MLEELKLRHMLERLLLLLRNLLVDKLELEPAVHEKQSHDDQDKSWQEIPRDANHLIGVEHPFERAAFKLQEQRDKG